MLGEQNKTENSYSEFDRETEKRHDIILMKAYRDAYESYMSACERYEWLIQIYRSLMRNKMETSASDAPVALDENQELTIRDLRRMIEKAYKEKSVIADRARECAQLLNASQYKM